MSKTDIIWRDFCRYIINISIIKFQPKTMILLTIVTLLCVLKPQSNSHEGETKTRL